MTIGISIVICSYNGAGRLAKTLACLADLDAPPSALPWEIIVVDNGSTDCTAEVARRFDAQHTRAPFTLLHESNRGLSFARRAGLDAARYELVSFIDDDNWVSPDWLTVVSDVMQEHPEAGACGGWVKPAWETDPPEWLKRFKHYYAVGRQAPEACDVCAVIGYLWGAGLTVRQAAWRSTLKRGFVPLTTGRRGNEPAAGDDEEICYALRLAGWGLWYDPQIRLDHFIPAHRMTWSYLRRMHRGFGAASALLEPYLLAQERPIERVPNYRGVVWVRLMLQSLRQALDRSQQLPPWKHMVGDPDVLTLESRYGRVLKLLELRGRFDENLRHVYRMAGRGENPDPHPERAQRQTT